MLNRFTLLFNLLNPIFAPMSNVRIIGFSLALVIILPFLVVSINAFNAELDVELIESLTEEENDQKDSEDGNYLFTLRTGSDQDKQPEEDQCSLLNGIFSHNLLGDLAFKVPTPPPEV